jgi:hypothetical protein
MVVLIKINTMGDIQTAVKSLERIKHQVPEMIRSSMLQFGKILEKDMKVSARRAGIKQFTGELQGLGIRWEQRKKGNVGALFIRVYGIYLDSMNPHYVNVTRRRTRLLLWAKAGARSSTIIEKAWMVDKGIIKKFSIYVKPHPYIRQGWATARPKLNPILRREISRGMKNV